MSWITASDLAWMRLDAANTLPDTCNLLAETQTSDGAGGWTTTLCTVTNGSALPCRFDPPGVGRGQNVVGGAEGMTYDYRVTLPYDAPVAINQQIQHNSKNYQVLQFTGDESWAIVTKVFVVRVV